MFLDRDGLINRKLENDYVKSWDEFQFLPGVIEAIKAINEKGLPSSEAKGYLVIVVTNQRGIAKGLMTEKDLEEIHRRMLKELNKHGARIDDIFYCPHDISDNCNCRKPKPGMLIQAQKKWNIDFARSFIIGDSNSDTEAGQRVGCQGILTTILSKAIELLLPKNQYLEEGEYMINLAIVGLGYWGPNLLRNFDKLKDCEVKICCDLNKGNLLRIKEEYSHIVVTKDYKDLVEDTELEAIVIATSASTHYSLAKEALLHGKHVLVEKPFTLNLEHATELIQFAEKTGCKLMVGHLMEYHPAIEKLKEIIQSGELGEIYYLYSQRVNLGKIRQDENALWSFAPHDLSIIMYLLETEPEYVSAQGQAYLQENTEDVVFATLRFPGKVMAHIQLSWLDPHKIRKMTIVGCQKMVVFDDMAGGEMIKIYDRGVVNAHFVPFGESLSLRFGDVSIPYIEMTEPLKLECQHFLDCIKNNETPRSDGKDGLRVVKVLKAAQRSLDKGGLPIRIQEN